MTGVYYAVSIIGTAPNKNDDWGLTPLTPAERRDLQEILDDRYKRGPTLENNEDRIVSVLHDMIEDTDWTLDQLRKEGFSQVVKMPSTRLPGENTKTTTNLS